MQSARSRADQLARAALLLSPAARIGQSLHALRDVWSRVKAAFAHRLELLRGDLEALDGRLSSLSPLAVLGRGYSLAWKLPENTLVVEADALSPGDTGGKGIAGGLYSFSHPLLLHRQGLP